MDDRINTCLTLKYYPSSFNKLHFEEEKKIRVKRYTFKSAA